MEAVRRKEKHCVADANAPNGQYQADFSKRERDTVYVGFKNAVSPLRVTIRLLEAISDNPKYNKFMPLLRQLKEKVLIELFEKCELIAQHTQKHCLGRKGNSTETEVFFNKVVGDFYRYMAEFTPKQEAKQLGMCKEKAQKAYTKAMEVAQNGFGFKKALDVCNSTRLSVSLHFANFTFELLG